MSLQAQISQAKEAKDLFITHINKLLDHMNELARNGNEAELKVFCNQMKAHGLDKSNDYDSLCSGARINEVRCFYS